MTNFTTEDWNWCFYEALANACESNIGNAFVENAGVMEVPVEFVWETMAHLYGDRWAEGCFLLPEESA